ncbi:MAG: zinc metalloprotease HtpX [Myxococcota bacterium]
MDTILSTHRLRNFVQAALLLLALTGLMATVGWLLAGPWGVVLAGGTAGVLLMVSPRVPTRWVLRMHGARALHPAEATWLFETVHALAARAGVPRSPHLYLLPSPSPTAFAVGERDDAALALSTGLVRLLSPRELEAVLAHELSHIRHRDTFVMRLASTFGAITRSLRAVGLLLLVLYLPMVAAGEAHFSFFAVILLLAAPVITDALQLALARSRELDADLGAVRLTGDPVALASALVRLEHASRGLWERLLGVHVPTVPPWLRTHPSTEERVRRLRALEPPDDHPRRGPWVPLRSW